MSAVPFPTDVNIDAGRRRPLKIFKDICMMLLINQQNSEGSEIDG